MNSREKSRESREITFTDDASLCEYYGVPVGAFDGDVRNIKLTYDFEISALTKIPRGVAPMRIGIGYDIHRLSPTVDRSVVPVGGVAIPCF